MTIEYGWGNAPASDVERARADVIGDSLGELVGRRLDRPTAHNIGKLFQKRLVNRPARIGDGRAVATLRRHQGHAENSYRVEVKGSPGSGVTSSDALAEEMISGGGLGPKHSPLSPLSPTLGGEENVSAQNGAIQLSLALARPGSGNVGKEGNRSARIGAADMTSPDGSGAIVVHSEALEPSPDDWELCHDPR
jgi:hypothetical protein